MKYVNLNAVPTKQSFERVLIEKKGYYCPVKIRIRKQILPTS